MYNVVGNKNQERRKKGPCDKLDKREIERQTSGFAQGSYQCVTCYLVQVTLVTDGVGKQLCGITENTDEWIYVK